MPSIAPPILDPLDPLLLESHPGLLRVERYKTVDERFLVVDADFTVGETLCLIQGWTRGPKAYSTVQVGPGQEDHIELNSSLLYTNHSCRPNVAFQVLTPGEPTNENDWKVVALQEIRKGETLSFFYPSTEWEMDRPFDCRCGEKECLRTIKGARDLSRSDLEAQRWISPHIWKLKDAQEQ